MATEYGEIRFNGDIQYNSNEEKEGYVKYPSKNGKVYYRKTVETGIEGRLVSLELSRHKYFEGNPEMINLGIKTEDGDLHVLSMVTRNQKGSYQPLFESLITQLPFIDKETVYKIFPYSFTPEGKTRAVRGISFKTKDGDVKVQKLIQSATYKNGDKVEGEIPEVIFKEDTIRGGWKVDDDNKLIYLKGVLDKALVDFARTPYTGGGSKPTNTSKPENVKKAELPNVDDDKDDLPF